MPDSVSEPAADRGNGDPVLDVDTGMTPDQLQESKSYGRRELACMLADMAIDVIYLSLMGLLGARVLDHWLNQWPLMENVWWRLSAIYFITIGLHYMVSFPLSFYSGFILEHQFGLSPQRFRRWFGRYLMKNVLVSGFGWGLIVGLFAIIWWTGPWWWLVAAAAMFVVTVLLGQLVPVLILPLFYKIERLDDESLTDRFRQLTRDTSLQIEGIYRMRLSTETVKANAMLAGLGRTRRVLLSDTLLDDFTGAEIAVVLAHEVGHHVHHHITKLILMGLVYSTASFFVCDRILVSWVTAQQGSFDYAGTPPYALPLIMLVVTVFSLLLSPLRSGLSRRFETQADRYALRVMSDAEAYRSAFSKLARQNKADPDPPALEVLLFHDHPPIAARLALADRPFS